MENLLLKLECQNEDAVIFEDLDDCIVGISYRDGTPCAAYSFDRIVTKYMVEWESSYEEAAEFVDFNIVGAWVGAATPIFLYDEVIECQ